MMIPNQRPSPLEELKRTIQSCTDDELHEVLGLIAQRAFVPYWLIPEEEDLPVLSGQRVSPLEFREFRDWFNLSDLSNEVEQLLHDQWLPDYLGEPQ